VFGAPTAISSTPSGPASNERIVSFGTRSASHCLSSTTSSSSFARALPPTTTYASSWTLCVCPKGTRKPGASRWYVNPKFSSSSGTRAIRASSFGASPNFGAWSSTSVFRFLIV
jgi:hypothetical protein